MKIKPICPHCGKEVIVNVKTIDEQNDRIVSLKKDLEIWKNRYKELEDKHKSCTDDFDLDNLIKTMGMK